MTVNTQLLNTEVETFLTDVYYINIYVVLQSWKKMECLSYIVSLILLPLAELMVYFRDEKTHRDSLVKGSYEI